MAYVITSEATLADIGDAIRSLNGESVLYKPSEMAGALRESSVDFVRSLLDKTIKTYTDTVSTTIGENAFFGCAELVRVDLHKATAIGVTAFYDCSKLETLIIRSSTVCTSGEVGRGGCLSYTPINSGTGYVYVPKKLLSSYKDKFHWRDIASQIRAIEDYPEITGG